MVGVGVVALAFACDNTTTTPAQMDMAKGPPDIADPPIPPDLRMPPPVLTSVAPAVIVNTGGMITITGQNFQTGATVTVGGTACANPTVTATQITCTAPAKAAMCGVQNIVVTNPDTQTVTSTPAMGLTYRTMALGYVTGAPANYTTGTFPRRVVAADFDGDGNMDIVSANQTGPNITILRGSATGTLTAVPNIALPAGATQPNDLVAVDLNGDNKMDLVTANGSNNVTVFLNMGASFTAVNYTTNLSASSIAAGDVNADGKVDIVVGQGNGTSVLPMLNNAGTGVLTMGTVRAVAGNVLDLALADMNGDGKLDIVTGNSTNNVSIALCTGAGTFGNPTNVNVGTTPQGVFVVDMDGNKKMDIVTANNGSNNVSVLLGDGAGGAAAAVNTATGGKPESLWVTDMDGDGMMDILTVNPVNPTSTLSYLRGTGPTQFAAFVNMNTGNTTAGIVVTDLNKDGMKDVAVASANGPQVQVYLQACK